MRFKDAFTRGWHGVSSEYEQFDNRWLRAEGAARDPLLAYCWTGMYWQRRIM